MMGLKGRTMRYENPKAAPVLAPFLKPDLLLTCLGSLYNTRLPLHEAEGLRPQLGLRMFTAVAVLELFLSVVGRLGM